MEMLTNAFREQMRGSPKFPEAGGRAQRLVQLVSETQLITSAKTARMSKCQEPIHDVSAKGKTLTWKQTTPPFTQPNAWVCP